MKGVEESLGKCIDEIERSKRDPVSICSVSESNTGQMDDPEWNVLQKDLEDLRISVQKLVEAGLRRHQGSCFSYGELGHFHRDCKKKEQ